jgi:heme exporter protein A
VVIKRAAFSLLYEPTTNLDVDGQQLVAELIDGQVRGGGIVVAAVHHPMGLQSARPLNLDLGP